MAAADSLSALPDHLLQHILSFAPAKEAAASTALSCRWRPLWLGTSTINLDSRSYLSNKHHDRYDVFFRDAEAAFLCRRRRLTVFLEKDAYRVDRWVDYGDEPEDDARVAGLLVNNPAAAGLEELRVQCEYTEYGKWYSPPLASLSCAATLRVLQLQCCNLEPPSSAHLAFPRLTDLTLYCCSLSEGYLQVLVDAAPALTSLALRYLRRHKSPETPGSAKVFHANSFHVPLRLRCRTVTALVLETNVCSEEMKHSRDAGIELDMPSLRYFCFRRVPVKLSLTSPAPELALVQVDTTLSELNGWRYVPVSCMLAGFSCTRALKLHLSCIEDLVTSYPPWLEEEQCRFILPTFSNLKLLQLDGKIEDKNSNTASAVMTLLRSCPAMSELRLRFNMRKEDCYRTTKDPVTSAFAQSKERFSRFMSMSCTDRDIVELDRVTDLPENNREYSFLRTSLRKVTLQFKSNEFNCFQVQLAKFLVENGMVLEEMHVDDGNQLWPNHLCNKAARWRADAFQKRNLPDTAGFRVYQQPAI
ncbi:hypothetical protein QYE76_038741 [Lolium multiflorum]|uniref:F-box/LRR-repeat protein 15/At3g58940/PEG3-like LRR domain-containing protein n=1 Tax=Lolium multiflorum TaxID=4521 RepID=A0AAD8T9J1_LOLMU|nr:hypothetical protein QYE76_038741 [Lolium multiflorum]